MNKKANGNQQQSIVVCSLSCFLVTVIGEQSTIRIQKKKTLFWKNKIAKNRNMIEENERHLAHMNNALLFTWFT